MKKKRWIRLTMIFVIFFMIVMVFRNSNAKTMYVVEYDGNNLQISVDGESASSLPTSGNYYLVSYSCKSDDTVLEWDRVNYKLSVSNGTKKGGVACYLEFESTPLLSEMEVGSYVAYTGSGGTVGNTSVACQTVSGESVSTNEPSAEASNSCAGENANQSSTDNYTYGYCYSSDYKYYVTGWRIAYTLDGKAMLVSAGSPECNTRLSSTANETYIQTANAAALKYCNSDYVDGDCTCVDDNDDGLCDSASTDAWAISDTDFYYITKALSGYGKRLTSTSSVLGESSGDLNSAYCSNYYSYRECGYGNDLIDNGGYYWFAARYSSSSLDGVVWTPMYRYVSVNNGANDYGLRPVISLQSSVIVTGGSGTIDDPYTIYNNTFSISDSFDYTITDDLTLEMMGYEVSSMCINLNSSGCENYVDYSETYSVDMTNAVSGENIIFVYYKNSSGKIIATMNKTITLS